MEEKSEISSMAISKRLKTSKAEKGKFILGSIISTALAGIGVVTGNIPLAASSASSAFSTIIGFPMGKRLAETVTDLADGLDKLQTKVDGFKIENLQGNDTFVTIVLHAIQIAARNHQKEKLTALRNAVFNCAIGNSPDEDLQLMFLNAIDSFTSWHLKILDYFRDPQHWFNSKNIPYEEVMGDASYGLLKAFPELENKREFYGQIVSELASYGYLQKGSYLNVMMSSSGVYSKRTSDIGDQFLNYIRSPLE
ncbi:MAG: hypothetical protein ACT4NJ_05885 [Nitrosopumilaceae archaeon]